MTVVADNKKRVTLRVAKPGERFDIQIVGDGQFVPDQAGTCPRAASC